MDKWDRLAGALQKANPGLEVLRNEPMARHTTFRIGGPAALFVRPREGRKAVKLCQYLRSEGVEPFFLGNGSNLLVADEGYDGVVVATQGSGMNSCIILDGRGVIPSGRITMMVEAGAPLSVMAKKAAEFGVTGLEFAAGIPGTLGGALVMNAGAYGGEIGSVVEKICYANEAGEIDFLSASECDFSYRHSIFMDHPGWFIMSCYMYLTPAPREEIEAKMADLAARRREKQPLDLPSAGSTFKRPAPVDGRPVYAAALIDQCGCKGLQVGGAKVSEKHAGFIVNAGGATCKDVLDLMEEVKKRVLDATGILLEPEVRVLK